MKKLLLFLFCGVLAASCIDKDYDLDKVKADDITIGDENSTYRIPLGTISMTLAEFEEGGVNIQEILSEANIWLPTVIPGGKGYIEINRITETAYVNTLLDALIAELSEAKTDKIDQVTNHIYTNFKDEFLPLLNIPSGVVVTEEMYKTVFKTSFALSPDIQAKFKEEAAGYLQDIKIAPIGYPFDKIDLGQEIIDMLTFKLDPEGVSNPKNTLHLYGAIESKLPLSMRLAPSFTQTNVKLANIIVEPESKNTINETRLFSEDIIKILNGDSSIDIPIELQKYYPNNPFNTQVEKQITITLHLVKRGGLTIQL